MEDLHGFSNLQTVFESKTLRVLRAIRREDNVPTVLKVLQGPDYTVNPHFHDDIRALRTHIRDIPGIARVLGLESLGSGFTILIHDPTGAFLTDLIASNTLKLDNILTIAIRIVDLLGALHASLIIHSAVTPFNLVYDEAGDQLTILPSAATCLPREHTLTSAAEFLMEGPLSYISPEQTGRIRLEPDYRSDYYSYGIVLYEMLTGTVPFDGNDTLGTIHGHLARPPIPPSHLNLEVPETVSNIVMKLLSKDREDRYQSSVGIRRDLKRCLHELTTTGSVAVFPVAQEDVPEQFRLSRKLYGRKLELEQLKKDFDRARSGDQELISVLGPAGSGKTSLVSAIREHVKETGGLFISGKFRQHGESIPYDAFIQAFQDAVQKLLTKEDDEIARWKDTLLGALATNGQVIASLIPQLELVIGPQPRLAEVGPLEAQHRFDLVFQSFIRVFCTAEQPLCLFLDDCQWADAASLRFIQWLMSGGQLKYVMIVFAYRDTEVDSNHPMSRALKALDDMGMSVRSIVLPPLSRQEIREILLDTFRTERPDLTPLEHVVHNNTAGNPLFVKEYLTALHLEHYIEFDPVERVWTWDLDRIKARKIIPSVVDLMSRRIGQLPDATQEMVKIASCLGNRFDISRLSAASGKSDRETLARLMPAIDQGLVVHLGGRDGVADSDDTPTRQEQCLEIRFTHDRIQQAAYELVPDSEKPHIHKRIGESLLPTLETSARDEDVFLVADQFNAAVALMESPRERLDLAALNLLAGRKAKKSAAHASAFDYFVTGIRLMGLEGWQDRYELCLDLHLEAAEAAWLTGRFDEAETLIASAVQNAQSLLDRVQAEEIAIQACFAKGNLREAIDRARAVLKELGIDLPRNPSKLRVLRRFAAAFLRLVSKRNDELLKLPALNDPLLKASMRVMAGVGTAAYFSAPEMIPLLMLEQARISLNYGKAPSSSFVYVCLGFIICGSLGMIEKGFSIGSLGVTLALEPSNERYAGRAIYVFNSLVRHWKEPIREAAQGMLDALDRARQSGDFEYVALGRTGYCLASYIAGETLDKLVEEMSEAVSEIRRLQQDPYLQTVEMHQQAALNLMDGETTSPGILKGEYYEEDERIAAYRVSNDVDSLFHVYSLKVCLYYLFGDYPQALVFADKARPHVAAALGAMQVPVFYFYEALTALSLYPSISRSQRSRLMKIVRANRRKFRKWAHHSPSNYLHKYHLIEAERFRVLGRHSDAMENYVKSIEAAKASEFVQEEGLARELFGQFLVHTGDRKRAKRSIKEARSCYAKWGARAKAKDVERRYAQFLGSEHHRFGPYSSDTPQVQSSEYVRSMVVPEEEALAKALQAISGEIVLANLIHKLMRVVMEVGGAERGFLLLEAGGELYVEAGVGPGQDDTAVLRSSPVQEVKAIPPQVVNYVFRTMELVTLDGTSNDALFLLDSHGDATKPKSVLCAPLIHQGRLVGLLYLENRLTAGAFSSDRTNVLRFLCSQAATLIENARMVEQLEDHSRHLEKKVRERTREYEIAVDSLMKEVHEKELAQRSLERALAVAAKLRTEAEAASAAKTEFLTNMSHELRTPLNAIIGFSELLEDQVPGRLNEKQLHYVRHVFNSGHHLLQLINDILDLAKVEAGKMDVRLGPVRLDHLLSNCTLMIKQKAFKHGLKVGLQISDVLEGVQIQADEVKLKQIVVNLLSNSVKFTPDGGRIDVIAKRNEGKIVIQVSDTGTGIKPEDQERIFEAFEQVESTHTRRFDGTGLGLALTRRLVELHQGTIGVESLGEQKGCTFTVTIPFIPVEAETREPDTAHDHGPRGVKAARVFSGEHRPEVLVIEDNQANMKLATSLLEAAGYHALQAWTAEEGIETARSKIPALIIMDISLPGMDGLTATRILKSDPTTAKIPVVALTAHTMKGDEEKSREAGCDAHLTKPIQTDIFYRTLEEYIDYRPDENPLAECKTY